VKVSEYLPIGTRIYGAIQVRALRAVCCCGCSGDVSALDLSAGSPANSVRFHAWMRCDTTAGVVSGLNRTIPASTGTRIYGAIQVR
jgi:hypothetical protein